MISKKNKICFLNNEEAVLGLPMRLTISIVIGSLVLVAILAFMLNPCLFPKPLVISINPQLTTIQDDAPENISFNVFVNDTRGIPISGAVVIIKGLGGAGSGFSDDAGRARITLQVQLEPGSVEGYLDISVKAPCCVSFEGEDAVKVVKN
jgi:hypothetical protein